MDFSVVPLLQSMVPFCDAQGKSFISLFGLSVSLHRHIEQSLKQITAFENQ